MMGRKRRQRARRVDTLIGENTAIHGDLEFSGGLHLEGRIVGDVRASTDGSAVLVVDEKGQIEGQVAVPHLVLNGSVRGDVHAGEHVELGEKARLEGNLYYSVLQMAEGASVDGQLRRRDADAALEGEAPLTALADDTLTTRNDS
ncbi:polymer-forming cytoskeletal protein [Thioalkalivibrio sp. ALgr3]|uniref:bactofilin family protein n=1 Tax=Thioalkalivibrio sp. ALgr3 TaxID=1239292 RepID=UPI00036D3AD2|nr:polymer-forming cytoskeletal protein [Thioalkalivibrio sp. ALgr3]